MKIYHMFMTILLAFSINVFAENTLRERVYVQTDKQTYISGELLWMKLYITDETGKPSSFSKIGYVELLDESDAHVQIKLDVVNGVGEGCMELPVSLPTGNYLLTAYTRNMRNESEAVFFRKTIGVINTFRANASIEIDSVADISFSPVLQDNNISVTAKIYTTRSQSEVLIQGLPEDLHSLGISIAGIDFVAGMDNIVKWHSLLPDYSSEQIKNDFLPEYEGHIISGKIVDAVTNEPCTEDGVYSLLGFTGDQLRIFGGMVDNEYNIQFVTDRITGSKEFAIAAIAPSDSKYRINIQSPFALHSERELPVFRMNSKWEDQLQLRSVGLQVLYAYFADSMSRADTTFSHFQWKPDRSYVLDEYTRFTTMEEIVIEFIPSLRFRRINNKRYLMIFIDENNTFSLGNSLVLLDGIPITDHDIIFRYNPLLVYKIDIFKDKFVFGNRRFEGVVSFTTYKHDYPGLILDETTQIFDYEGTQLRRHFYSPLYPEKSDAQRRMPDYRHTLLWMPDVKTGGQPSLSVPFSTSDLTGTFQITVEGLTKGGKFIRGTSFFNVEN